MHMHQLSRSGTKTTGAEPESLAICCAPYKETRLKPLQLDQTAGSDLRLASLTEHKFDLPAAQPAQPCVAWRTSTKRV